VSDEIQSLIRKKLSEPVAENTKEMEGDFALNETALRETEEEVGLFRDYVTVWGTLDRYRTGSGYSILPVVAHVKTGFTLTIDEGEVADTFEVPFSFLMDPDNHNKDKAYWQGKERIFYSMPYDGFKIWGATAGILVNLYHRLYG
jgi:8-oxo-dGTP pyrophosphatase MutT (NUDIX family)